MNRASPPAAERRQMIAHGARRGLAPRSEQPRQGRKNRRTAGTAFLPVRGWGGARFRTHGLRHGLNSFAAPWLVPCGVHTPQKCTNRHPEVLRRIWPIRASRPRACECLSMTAFGNLATIFGICLLLTGCWKENMGSQPKAKPMQASILFADGTSARPLPLGVISRDATQSDSSTDNGFIDGKPAETFPAHYPTESDGPFPTRGPQLRRVLARGQLEFTIYCSMCHGDSGDGRGIIVQRGMVQPPSYHLDRLRQAPIGHFVDVITNGYGAMYSYGDRVSPADRWAIAAYIRTLQMTQGMPADAIKEAAAQ